VCVWRERGRERERERENVCVCEGAYFCMDATHNYFPLSISVPLSLTLVPHLCKRYTACCCCCWKISFFLSLFLSLFLFYYLSISLSYKILFCEESGKSVTEMNPLHISWGMFCCYRVEILISINFNSWLGETKPCFHSFYSHVQA